MTEVGKTDAESLRPYLETALDAFGADRLMFGSDWPVVTAHLPYAGWKAVVESFTAALSASEREKIMSDNAASFYDLSI